MSTEEDFAEFDVDIRPARVENMDDFLLYLEDHLAAARDLFLSSGFVEVGRNPDLFRIPGHSVGAIQMGRRIRSVGRQHESGLL